MNFLSENPFVIALAQGHPLIQKAKEKPGYPFPVLDVRLLKNEPLILLHPQQRIRHVSDAILAKARITPNIVLILKNYETAQHLAGQGIGITFLPMEYAALTSADHPPVLLSIDESYSPSWDLSIASLKGGFLSRADQYFLDLVRQKFFTATKKQHLTPILQNVLPETFCARFCEKIFGQLCSNF